MNHTKIEWVRNPDGMQGYTWNPITGCLNGCPYCYARKLANTRLKERYLANKNWDTRTPAGYEGYPNLDPFYPRSWFNRRERTLESKKPKGIFVCDMSDLFGIGIPDSWTECVLETIKVCPEHRFYLLTKQPQNLPRWSPFPENCWVGVSVTNEGITYPDIMEQACRSLAEIKATIKYISFEPLLSSIYKLNLLEIWGIKWVIIGAQTKPYKPPKIEWVSEIAEACDKVGIPVFLKNNLKPILAGEINGETVIESHNLWAFKYFKLRQEFPNA